MILVFNHSFQPAATEENAKLKCFPVNIDMIDPGMMLLLVTPPYCRENHVETSNHGTSLFRDRKERIEHSGPPRGILSVEVEKNRKKYHDRENRSSALASSVAASVTRTRD